MTKEMIAGTTAPLRSRGFELIEGLNGELPKRSTSGSAGYDFAASEDVVVPSLLVKYEELQKNIERWVSLLGRIANDEIMEFMDEELSKAEKAEDGTFQQHIFVRDILIKACEMLDEETLSIFGYSLVDAIGESFRELLTKANPVLVPTGVKSYMENGVYLQLANRSSNPKKGFTLANGVGIIDSDYYNNKNNEGHIMFQFINLTPNDAFIKKGDKIGQGIFLPFLLADGDDAIGIRNGGFGSTDKEEGK